MSDAYLAVAARDRIRSDGAIDDKHCNVEWDEKAPAAADDFYIMVVPGGVTEGPENRGDIEDRLYGLNVAIAIRRPRVPRDRDRDIWVATTRSFDDLVRKVNAKVDMDYTLINSANSSLISNGLATGDCDTFIEPLSFESLGPIRPAPAELFAGRPGENVAALIRTIRYRGARRMVARSFT